jgi:membrane protein DedA with SNARE-associated domain/rhodanese-related sulfurtransferase
VTEIIVQLDAHGLGALSLGVLLEQLGLPLPAMPLLLVAGAHSAADGLFALRALASAAAASMAADTFWFLIGRRYGRSVLSLFCRMSLSADTCVQKSEASFARRGVLTLLFAKFIPGVSALATPVAGAMRMPIPIFLLVNFAGTVLWAGSGIAAGMLFHQQVHALMQRLEGLGSRALLVVVCAVAAYAAWRSLRRVLARRALRAVRTITVDQLAAMMDRAEPVTVVDVRSAAALPLVRIPGAVHAPLESRGPGAATAFAQGRRIVTYCDCPGQISAARAAHELARSGHDVYALEGGLSAWVNAGLPVETMQPSLHALSQHRPDLKQAITLLSAG